MAYNDVVSKVQGLFGNPEEKKKQVAADTLAKEVMRNYERAKTAKEDTRTKWIEYIKLWRGDHWKGGRESWKSQTTENICFSVVETMIPLLGDRQPVVQYLPQLEDDITLAKQLNHMADYTWNDDDMDNKFPSVLRDMLILGTAILKMRLDTEKRNGFGAASASQIDPFHFFPDPDATDAKYDMDWCIFRTKMSTKEIKRLYNKDVPSDSEFQADDHNRPTDVNRNALSNSHVSTKATVLEYWYKDENGRIRVAVVSNGVLLDDKESPFEINEFPFIFFYDHKLKGEFWGIGEFENLKPLQMEMNKLRAMLMDNLIAMNNSMILVDNNSGIKVENLRNEPGLIIEKTPGSKIERLVQPPFPQDVPQHMESTKQSMQDISGIADVARGLVANSQVSSGSGLQILTENSQTRLRAKLRNVETAVKEMSRWYLVIFRQYYTEPVRVRLSGRDEDFKWTDFNGQELRTQAPKIGPDGQPVIDPQTGEPVMEELLTDFDIKVSSGSSMLMNKSAKYQQLLEMYNAKAVDLETLLIGADIGEPKEIIARMIKYGMLADPNSPKFDVAKVLGDLGIRVTMTTNEPEAVLTAIQHAQEQIQQVEQQTGTDLGGTMNNQLKDAKNLENISLGGAPTGKSLVPNPTGAQN